MAAGDHDMEVPKDRRGDRGQGLPSCEPVLLAGGQVGNRAA